MDRGGGWGGDEGRGRGVIARRFCTVMSIHNYIFLSRNLLNSHERTHDPTSRCTNKNKTKLKEH